MVNTEEKKMKKRLYLMLLFLFGFLFLFDTADAYVIKWIRVNRINHYVYDSGVQCMNVGGGQHGFYYFDAFNQKQINRRGTKLVTRNWTDTTGTTWPFRNTGSGHIEYDEEYITMPVPDEVGITIRKYVRYAPPTIEVDGMRLDEPFPMTGDEVNPDKIPGTADVMIESFVRTHLGLDIHQKVLAWSQTNHDDYIIWDWTIKNTGNVDLDDKVELPAQTIEIYFFRALDFQANGRTKQWLSSYGEYPEDSLRILYAYPKWYPNKDYDDFGDPSKTIGYIKRPAYVGEAILHADVSVSDHSNAQWQPHMTGYEQVGLQCWRNQEQVNGPDMWQLLYQISSEGFKPYNGFPEIEGAWTYPDGSPTHHTQRFDENETIYFHKDYGFPYRGIHLYAIGPYIMAPGDEFRVVWAKVFGSISPEVAWEKGRQWLDGTCTWDGPDNLPAPAERIYRDI